SGRSTQGLADSTGRADPADPSGGMRSALAQLRAGRPGADQSGCGDLGPWHAEGPDALSRPDYFTGRGWGACRPDYTRSAGPVHVAEIPAGAHETPPRSVGASRSGLALHDGHSAPGSAPPAGLRLADPVRRENPPARERLAVVARSGGDAQDDER